MNSAPALPIAEEQPLYIGIPSKTTGEVDWALQLGIWLEEACQEPAPVASSQWAPEIARLNRLRQDARGAETTLAGRDLIVRYYGQLEALSKRFPTQRPLTHLEFSWGDAFAAGQMVKQTSLAFEKCNWLFNLAALLSRLPCHGGSGGADGAVGAASHFQAAANLLNWLGDNFLHPPLLDIQRPCLAFLSCCMQAQAQECVAWRGLREGKSRALLAKLWAGTAALYADTLARFDHASAQAMRHAMQRATQTRTLLLTKQAYFAAGAELLQAGVAMEQAEQRATAGAWGEAIARLDQALHLLASVEHEGEGRGGGWGALFASSPPAAQGGAGEEGLLGRHVGRLRGRIEAVREQAIRENGLIYHEPTTVTIPPIEQTILVSRQPAKSLWAALSSSTTTPPEQLVGPDLFARLVPLQALTMASEYSERLAGLVRLEAQRVNEAEAGLQACLQGLGFPAALEQIQRLPDELIALRLQARQQAKLTAVEQSSSATAKLQAALEAMDLALGQELEQWEQDRRRHGSGWPQPPSEQGNAALYAQLAGLKATLLQLSQTRQAQLTEYEGEARDLFARLCQPGETGLLQGLARVCLLGEADDATGGTPRLRTKLESLLQQVETLSRHRLAHLEQLKLQVQADDLTDKITAKTTDKEALMDREMSKHDGLCRQLEEACSQQRPLLEQLKETWHQLTRQEQAAWHTEAGQLYLRQLTAAFSHHVHLLRLESEYAQTLSQLTAQAQQLESVIGQWVQARATERAHLLATLQQDATRRSQEMLKQRLASLHDQGEQGKQSHVDQTVESNKTAMTRANALLARLSHPSEEKSPAPREPSLLD